MPKVPYFQVGKHAGMVYTVEQNFPVSHGGNLLNNLAIIVLLSFPDPLVLPGITSGINYLLQCLLLEKHTLKQTLKVFPIFAIINNILMSIYLYMGLFFFF